MAATRMPCLMAALLTAAAAVAGQTRPQFEVASVRPSAELSAQSRGGLTITERQARFSLLSLKDYIGIATGLRVHQIVGPDWLATERFEIAATIPEPFVPDTLDDMMLALLEDRFGMRSHRESREFPVYALEVESAARLVKVPEEEQNAAAFTVTSGPAAGGGVAVDLGQGASLLLGNNRFEAKRVTMTTLADALGRFVDRPVVDMTNLTGRYDIAFELAPEDFQAMMIRSAVAAGITLPPQALQLLDKASPAAVLDALKSSGLALNGRRAPQEVIVIDSMERVPTEN